MNCANQWAHRVQNLSFCLFSAGLLIGSFGCSGGALPDGASGDQGSQVERVSQDMLVQLPGWAIIVNKDSRPISSYIIWLDATDRTGQYYSDSEQFSGIKGYGASGMGFVQTVAWDTRSSPNSLHDSGGYWLWLDHSEIHIFDQSKLSDGSDSGFNQVKVTMRAYIDGACHEDWEMLNLRDKPTVYFDGRNASWNGSCRVGDLLHH